MAQPVNSLPAMQQTQVQSLGEEDPLEKRMATHSSVLAWEIPWTEEPSGPQSSVSNSQTLLSTHTQTHRHTHTHTHEVKQMGKLVAREVQRIIWA